MEYLKAQYATQEGIISLQENSFRLDEDQQVIMDNTQKYRKTRGDGEPNQTGMVIFEQEK